MERELKEKDDKEEVFVGEVGETDFPEPGKKKKIIRIVILIAVLLVLVGIGVTLFFLLRGDKKEDKKEKATILMDDSKFKKPKTLTKKYELVQLKDSKYKFILVHDPITLNGGIEIRTKYGFDTEPIDGFAHYAEHIFNHGTKDINKIDIYGIIRQFNEFINAYTWDEETVFQYFGSNYTFDTVLYYVSEFIKHPQLNESKYMTEINAVNSEYDSYNYSQSIVADILIDNANPEHPFSQSITGHTGNNDTLHSVNSTELGELLKNYFRTIFKPENCIFVLYSSKSFSEMIDYADKYFNFKLEEPTEEFTEKFNQKVKALDNPIFKKDQLGKIATYNSISEIPLMLFIFPISQKENNYIEVTYILYYLFDNTEEGSFKKYLLDNNYISEGSSEYYGYYKKYEIVAFGFYLTKDGFENIDKIIEALFASINVIKEDKNLDEKLNNFKLIEEKAFYFKEETSSAFPDDIDLMLRNYHLYGPEKILLGSSLNECFSIENAKNILDELSPDNCFITIDSQEQVNSKYIENPETLYIRSYKAQYKINKISEDNLSNLKNIKSIENYELKPRGKNEKNTKLEGLTQNPCYEQSPKKCENKEYNPEDKDYEPYEVQKRENVVSLMKIDRSYGIPFVKGYIDFGLEENFFKENITNSEESKAMYYLILKSLNRQFYQSDFMEAKTALTVMNSYYPNIQIYFNTYNDLLEDVINYIINLLKNPIDEKTFTNLKELYILENAKNNDEAHFLIYEAIDIFKSFITVDTFQFKDFSPEYIINSNYTYYKQMFSKVQQLISNLKYLTHGDITLAQSNSTTNLLSSLIKEQEVILKSTVPTNVELPEKSNIFFSTQSPNKYERQGATMVGYEYDEKLAEKMEIYSYCAYDVLFDYIRSQRGSGYVVGTTRRKILNKNYLLFYAIGKVYSPEQMDRLINEGIEESFNYKKCQVGLIIDHLKNKANLVTGYPEEKFGSLMNYLYPAPTPENETQNETETKNLYEEEITLTYESIIKDIKDVFIKPKRVSILYHRGDLTKEELEKQVKGLETDYYFDTNIKAEVTDEITYLEKYLNNTTR